MKHCYSQLRWLCVYNDDLRNLYKTHDPQSGEDLSDSVDLLLSNLPESVWYQRDFKNSDHDVFNAKDIEGACKVAENFLRGEGQGRVFSSAVNFAS